MLRANYSADLIAERLTGTSPAGFTSGAMQWGIDTEPAAKAAYTARTGMLVEEAGFVDHPEIVWSGASPDGYVQDDGLIEVKCPNTATHLASLLGAEISRDYLIQMQWQMACTGRAWCDHVSFDPRLPDWLHLHIRRVPRNTSMILELEEEVSRFLDEVAQRVERLTALYWTEREAAA